MPLTVKPSQESFVPASALSTPPQEIAAAPPRSREFAVGGEVPNGAKWQKEARRHGVPANAVAQMEKMMQGELSAMSGVKQFAVVYGSTQGRHARSGYVAGVRFMDRNGDMHNVLAQPGEGGYGPKGMQAPALDEKRHEELQNKLAETPASPSPAGRGKRSRLRARLRHSHHARHHAAQQRHMAKRAQGPQHQKLQAPEASSNKTKTAPSLGGGSSLVMNPALRSLMM